MKTSPTVKFAALVLALNSIHAKAEFQTRLNSNSNLYVDVTDDRISTTLTQSASDLPGSGPLGWTASMYPLSMYGNYSTSIDATGAHLFTVDYRFDNLNPMDAASPIFHAQGYTTLTIEILQPASYEFYGAMQIVRNRPTSSSRQIVFLQDFDQINTIDLVTAELPVSEGATASTALASGVLPRGVYHFKHTLLANSGEEDVLFAAASLRLSPPPNAAVPAPAALATWGLGLVVVVVTQTYRSRRRKQRR